MNRQTAAQEPPINLSGKRGAAQPAGITVTLDRPDSPRVAHALELLTDALNATRRTCPAIADHWPTNWPSPEPQR